MGGSLGCGLRAHPFGVAWLSLQWQLVLRWRRHRSFGPVCGEGLCDVVAAVLGWMLGEERLCLVLVVLWGLLMLRHGLLYFGPIWSEGLLLLGLRWGLILRVLLAVGARLASGPVQRHGLRLCLL